MFAYIRPEGFTTNSSSSHHIIRLKETEKIRNDPENDMGYGWRPFTLAMPKSKAEYLAVAAKYTFKGMGLDLHSAKVLTEHYLPDAAGISDEQFESSYIDHQSSFSLPRPRTEETSMGVLFDWLNQEVVRNDQVLILGGNDNDEDGHPLLGHGDDWWRTTAGGGRFDWGEYASGLDSDIFGGMTFRQDAAGFLTFFSPNIGAKYRTFLPGGIVPSHASVPDTVDVKITQECLKNCAYCYQDSGIGNEHAHADIQVLYSLSRQLGEVGVFEVAIGGGEPTLHPSFGYILRAFRDAGIVPNFATGTIDWLKDDRIVSVVKEYAGQVAFSTQDPIAALRWQGMCLQAGIHNPAVHYILGASPLGELLKFLNLCGQAHMTVVLLKLRMMGRATKYGFKAHETDGWQQIALSSKAVARLAVDDALAAELKDHPRIDARTIGQDDGRFSCYYDAVKGEAAANSFSLDRMKVDPYHFMSDFWRGKLTRSLG